MNAKLENSVGLIETKWGEELTIFENGIHLKMVSRAYGTKYKEILYDNLEHMGANTLLFNSILSFEVKGGRDSIWELPTQITFEGRKKAEIVKGQIEEIQKYDYPNYLKKKAAIFEDNLDYDSAIKIWEQLGETNESKRIRKLVAEQGTVKMDQTVVHGDYVDDRDTIVKDSVVNKSNIGAGGKSKAEKLREVKALLDDGIIDADDYEKMKREIIG